MEKSSVSSCPFAGMKSTSSSVDERQESDETDSASFRRKSRDSNTNPSGSSSCPFVQALHNNDSDDSSSSDLSATSAMLSSPPSPGSSTMLWKQCPAFANRSCPFKDVKSPDDVSEILKELPASHTNQTIPSHAILIETLAYFHRDQAIEEYSFSAIMSRLT